MKKTLYILLFIPLFGLSQTIRYVSVSGAGAHNGTSEANAYTLSEALAVQAPDMEFRVKAGNYGTLTRTFSVSGTAGNLIKWIGYKTTFGDVSATTYSTYDYGDSVSSTEMPLIIGSTPSSGVGINVNGNYVHLENIQVSNFATGLNVNGDNVTLKNVIGSIFGTQGTGSTYNGNGFHIYGDNALIESCYVENANAENLKLFGSANSIVRYTKVYGSYAPNPTDYYLLLTGGATNNVVEFSEVRRVPGLSHGGHGITLKDLADNNIIRNCTAINTSIELNFSGVVNNNFEDCTIYGGGRSASEWPSTLAIMNGADNNLFERFYIYDTWQAVTFHDNNDGYVGPGGDRDEIEGSTNNTFNNFIIRNVDRIIGVDSHIPNGGSVNATSYGNAANNWTVINSLNLMVQYHNVGITFKNIGLYNVTNGITNVNSKTQTITYTTNARFGGGTITGFTSLNPLFVNAAGTTTDDFEITSSSAWKDVGTNVSGLSDYNKISRPVGASTDIGAFEYSAGGGDVTAPTVTSVTVSEITDVSARVTWYLDEGATGQLEYGTTTGYGSTTTLETNYLTGHSQVISGLIPSTLYHYNIIGADAAANNIAEVDRTFTTEADPDPEPEPPLIEGGVKSRYLKFRKF